MGFKAPLRTKSKMIENTEKRPSMRRAINAKCLECLYDPTSNGNWRQQIQACTEQKCALYPLRPVSNPRKDGSL